MLPVCLDPGQSCWTCSVKENLDLTSVRRRSAPRWHPGSVRRRYETPRAALARTLGPSGARWPAQWSVGGQPCTLPLPLRQSILSVRSSGPTTGNKMQCTARDSKHPRSLMRQWTADSLAPFVRHATSRCTERTSRGVARHNALQVPSETTLATVPFTPGAPAAL